MEKLPGDPTEVPWRMTGQKCTMRRRIWTDFSVQWRQQEPALLWRRCGNGRTRKLTFSLLLSFDHLWLKRSEPDMLNMSRMSRATVPDPLILSNTQQQTGSHGIGQWRLSQLSYNVSWNSTYGRNMIHIKARSIIVEKPCCVLFM